ncbi:hypothetical protein [Methylobacterium symbioticum]|uniref:hypothetical protein n=1 Tax=Methylobacterium symbioticum TaxID=2584084 RepID=UPI00115B47F8|nr:hypothetical protein [Methylobacterium symbioticum]
MIDVFSDADRDACAREAAEAIEVVLDQRCPDMKIAFWSAVERLYRLDALPDEPLPAAPSPSLYAQPPARSR